MDLTLENIRARDREKAALAVGGQDVLDELIEFETSMRKQHWGSYAVYYAGALISFGTVNPRWYGEYMDRGLTSMIAAAYGESLISTNIIVVAASAGKKHRAVCSFRNGEYFDGAEAVRQITAARVLPLPAEDDD